jgi:hypothetical protein
MAPFGAAAGISASLRLRLRYAPIPAILRTPPPGTQASAATQMGDSSHRWQVALQTPSWTGKYHSTKFRARPTERMKGWVWMPAEKVARAFLRAGNRLKKEVRRLTAPRS